MDKLDEEVKKVEVEEEPEKKDPLAAAKKVFRITNRKPESNDKLRLELSCDVEWDDAEDGKRKVGVFRARRLNLGGLSQFKVLEAQMNGGQNLASDMLYLHRAEAYCAVAVVKAPEWWKPEEFFSADPVVVLYEHLRQHWESFRGPGVGE